MKRLRAIFHGLLVDHAHFICALFYGDFWSLRTICRNKRSGFAQSLYYSYLESQSSWIGLGAEIDQSVEFPHGIRSVFISDLAKIGTKCVIYQQVTIGSVRGGAPTIGENVIIGAGAIIVGGCVVGDNAKIGAGAVIRKDVPSGVTCVSGPMRIIGG